MKGDRTIKMREEWRERVQAYCDFEKVNAIFLDCYGNVIEFDKRDIGWESLVWMKADIIIVFDKDSADILNNFFDGLKVGINVFEMTDNATKTEWVSISEAKERLQKRLEALDKITDGIFKMIDKYS